jgi:hypothetical protein
MKTACCYLAATFQGLKRGDEAAQNADADCVVVPPSFRPVLRLLTRVSELWAMLTSFLSVCRRVLHAVFRLQLCRSCHGLQLIQVELLVQLETEQFRRLEIAYGFI